MVVEDDLDLREIIVSFLESKGWCAHGVPSDGRLSAALDEADTVVLDVRSIASVGFKLLERLRASRPNLSVIVIASFGDSFVSRSAERLGATSVLEKPFDLEDLERSLLQNVTEAKAVVTSDSTPPISSKQSGVR